VALVDDGTNLVETGTGVWLGSDATEGQWNKLVRLLKALTAISIQKVGGGSEPTDILEGWILGLSPNRNEWRIKVVGTDLLVQENTGSEGTPTWTTRNTFATGSGLTVGSDHGLLAGLTDDDHTQYVLVTGTRKMTGSLELENAADATLSVEVDSGTSAQQISQLILSDRGTQRWAVRKNASGNLIVRDLVNSQDIMTVTANSGADRIIINSTGVGIGQAASGGKELDVLGDIRASADVATVSLTASGAVVGASVNATSPNELTKAWGVTESTPSSSSGTLTLDFQVSNYFEVTLTENITTVTISNLGIPGPRSIVFKQAAASSFTIAGWPAAVLWAGDAAPVMPSGFDDEKIVTIVVKSNAAMRGVFSDDITV
jgi:hypothetical protein